ncbi:MAG TPA: CGNR zinc finger domain-containing protein [Streptosporangiaceae bacterium]
MSFTDYDLNAVSMALDLASLGDGTLSYPDLVERQRDMFVEHGYGGEEFVQPRLTELGRRIAKVLATPAEGDFLDALADLLTAQDCKPYLTRHDGVPHLHYARDAAPFGEWVPTMAVAGLVVYVCRHGRSRLRRCAGAGCGRWFADTSRNSSRRYCEHACASRTTVAAFRARQRAGSPARQRAGQGPRLRRPGRAPA